MPDYFFKETFQHAENLPKGEYENCTFQQGKLLQANLAACKFVDCEFINCDLSMAILDATAFRSVKFIDCKMLALRLDKCNPLGFFVNFDNCQLSQSVFYKMQLKGAQIIKCKLHEVDFSECDLREANFEASDLLNATFISCNLEKADFRQAFNFNINPTTNKLKHAKFRLEGLPGLLSVFNIKIED